MKKLLPLLLAALLIASFAACAGSQPAKPTEAAASDPLVTDAPENTAEPDTTAAPDTTVAGGKTLVVYFSATGTTKGVAETIASLENADLYEIEAAQPYTAADLNWNDKNSRTTLEQNDKSARPAIGSEPLSLNGYTKIYVGYPIWWGEEPRILDTFAESYDFSDITLIPFCTSGGSGIGRSGQNLAQIAGSGNWLDGQRFAGGVSAAQLQTWIDTLQ